MKQLNSIGLGCKLDMEGAGFALSIEKPVFFGYIDHSLNIRGPC